jgi:hypothetical protein
MRSIVFSVVLILNVGGDVGTPDHAPISTVLWASCSSAAASSTDDGPITLHGGRPRPASLWFSRDEPLIDLDGPLRANGPGARRGTRPLRIVYYRITKLKSMSNDVDLVRAFQERVTADLRPITAQRANRKPGQCSARRPLLRPERVVISISSTIERTWRP